MKSQMRMQLRWSRLAALVRRRIRYKITRGGVLFVVALIVVAASAAISANNLLFLIVAAMFATFSVSGLVSRLVLAGSCSPRSSRLASSKKRPWSA